MERLIKVGFSGEGGGDLFSSVQVFKFSSFQVFMFPKILKKINI